MVRYLYAAESCIIGSWITHVVIAINKSMTFLFEDQKFIQLVAPTIRMTISIAKIKVNAVSALLIISIRDSDAVYDRRHIKIKSRSTKKPPK
jgi:hypothetical protein